MIQITKYITAEELYANKLSADVNGATALTKQSFPSCAVTQSVETTPGNFEVLAMMNPTAFTPSESVYKDYTMEELGYRVREWDSLQMPTVRHNMNFGDSINEQEDEI